MPTKIEIVDRKGTTIGAGTTSWWALGLVELRPKLTVSERDALGMLPDMVTTSPSVWLNTAHVLSHLRKLKRDRYLADLAFAPTADNDAALHADTLLDLVNGLRRAGHRLFRFRVPDEQFRAWRIEGMDGTIGAIAPCLGADPLPLATLVTDGAPR